MLYELRSIIEPYVDGPIVNFRIERSLFDTESGREDFNRTIRKNVDKKCGVYIWIDETTQEIVYIGMAGKIKTNGMLGNHTIQDRLIASRGKDKENKDIQTNDFVRDLMTINNINTLTFYVMYSKTGEPPAYIEALLLYKFYKANNVLPRFNSSF